MENNKDIVTIYETWSVFKMAADAVVVSSNIHGACPKRNSLMSQAFSLAGEDFKNDFEQDMRFTPKYGEVRLFDSYKLNHLFKKIMVTFPGTGSAGDMLIVFKTILDTMASLKLYSISIPLIGTNVGGISVSEWAKQFNIALNQYYERRQSFEPLQRINILFSYYDNWDSTAEDIKDMIDDDFIEVHPVMKLYNRRYLSRAVDKS